MPTFTHLLRGVRVLVVEDEGLLAAELSERLTGADMVVVGCVDSGAAALLAAEAQHPDIVLMDIRIKGPIDGIETAIQLQQRAPAAVVFLTAHSDDDTLERARAAGANGYLGKPVRERDLVTTIATALERFRLEQTTRELNALLVERTRQLEAKNRELDEFASVVSHDLHAPLRNIRMLLDLLGADAPLAGEDAEVVARARRNALRMGTLIDSLLALARAGSRALATQDLDAAAVCQEAVADLREAIESAGAVVSLPEAGCAIHGDPTLLRQLLQNLVANALKFRRPGVAPRIAIEARPVDGGAAIRVRDNGIGFAPEDADRLFQRFTRLATARAYDGLGIGLATCARIVERHHGVIRAQGEPGVGAQFEVVLPGGAAAEAAAASAATAPLR